MTQKPTSTDSTSLINQFVRNHPFKAITLLITTNLLTYIVTGQVMFAGFMGVGTPFPKSFVLFMVVLFVISLSLHIYLFIRLVKNYWESRARRTQSKNAKSAKRALIFYCVLLLIAVFIGVQPIISERISDAKRQDDINMFNTSDPRYIAAMERGCIKPREPYFSTSKYYPYSFTIKVSGTEKNNLELLEILSDVGDAGEECIRKNISPQENQRIYDENFIKIKTLAESISQQTSNAQ